MGKKLIIFPDTNLFLQCKPLTQLNWSFFKDYEEIDVIVSRPVQVEIDKNKGGGNQRLSHRSRAASSVFRDILFSESKCTVLSEQAPKVKMYLDLNLRAEKALAELIDLDSNDNQLVAIAKTFSVNNSDVDVLVLTDDTGVIFSAQTIKVDFQLIDPEWMLPPENDSSKKRINELENELKKIKNTEPVFDLGGLDISENYEINYFEALDESEIAFLLNRIQESFPLVRDFEVSDDRDSIVHEEFSHQLLKSFSFFNQKEYIPANTDEINKYTEELYPEWLEKSEHFLRNLHIKLNERIARPVVKLWGINKGGVPAENVLITLSVKGNLFIQPYEPGSIEDIDFLSMEPVPVAPKGEWVSAHSRMSKIMASAGFQDYQRINSDWMRSKNIENSIRKPDEFYYREKPSQPVKEYQLENNQWRHQIQKEYFEVMLDAALHEQTVSGYLQIDIHAKNLINPVNYGKGFKLIVRKISAFDKAKLIVNNMQ